MNSFEYIRYSRSGTSLDLPKHLRVKKHIPNFYAAGKSCAIGIEMNPCDVGWESCQAAMRGSLAWNPMLQSKVLREGSFQGALPGDERVIEYLMEPTHEVSFAWLLALVSGANRCIVHIFDDGTFAEKQELWTAVVNSIRIDPVQAKPSMQPTGEI